MTINITLAPRRRPHLFWYREKWQFSSITMHFLKQRFITSPSYLSSKNYICITHHQSIKENYCHHHRERDAVMLWEMPHNNLHCFFHPFIIFSLLIQTFNSCVYVPFFTSTLTGTCGGYYRLGFIDNIYKSNSRNSSVFCLLVKKKILGIRWC